ncbi:type ISP restriction/modification enzyme [Actinacidiphila oryziradicis]|uniref:site-specific DNA-methyltransferase (adenine-specific) n=1 Tax=Actinacidiphila oryziradicis TaxID=2571141 RepID=A0A4U0T8W3_9ACTN|nr:type ISP restriction/modification enzyme [Actinacidiphila oryziradicis]TKA11955.1 N-6 DNA methylase [Actinacidiphila oryziradicis]
MEASGWIERIVARFGVDCKKILGVGENEAGIRSAVERLLDDAAREFGLRLNLHPEARMPDLGIRPDFAASIGEDKQRIFGYLELKSPTKKDISPGGLRGDDRKQWEGMAQLTNVIYTNGQSWFLYRVGQQIGCAVYLEGDLYRAGDRLRAPGAVGVAFEKLLREFLIWQPKPLRNVRQLVSSVAPLCRLLRAQVYDRLKEEERSGNGGSGGRRGRRPFSELAEEWEHVLFPRTDERDHQTAFADRYAQTITFALLLARVEEISLTGRTLHEVGDLLRADHTVMGRALQLLTDDVGQHFRNSLDVLVRVIDAVDWAAIIKREPEAHVYLYQHFLQEYDPELRKASGTYYTPASLVHEMVRLVDEVLRLKLNCEEGFADSQVSIIDPAMGTGTFLSAIIDRVVKRRSAGGNDGFRAEAVEELAQRLMGFEKQMAAYAVAQMRIAQTLRGHDSDIRLKDLRLHLNDTLADPWKRNTLFGGAASEVLRQETELANEIKREQRVTVVIGNPPYRERAQGEGGWIEQGREGHGQPLLDDFRLRGANGTHENKLKNLYVYFWRWATYKVFEQHHPEHQQGVVCFVTTAGFLRGPGFRGMREYLRSTCTEGWIIDLTPEEKLPPVLTRFFPGVQRKLAVALFVRKRNEDPGKSSPVHYVALTGSREDKLRQLQELRIDGPGWRTARPAPQSPFTPASETGWDDFPALGELMPWQEPGVKTNRTWVYGPDRDKLRERWDRLVLEPDPEVKRGLFKETRDLKLGSVVKKSLPRQRPRPTTLMEERGRYPEPVPVIHRSFDRQWLLPDSRVIDYPRLSLWEAERGSQIFVIEQHSQPIRSGPAVIFSSLIPDMHCFNNNGGRVLPLQHADGSPNTAPGLLEHLANSYGVMAVPAEDLLSYLAGITAHPAFTQRFTEDLNSLGVRVPLTADRELWSEAVRLGRRAIWASTFGERCASEEEGRSRGIAGVKNSAVPSITYPTGIDPAVLPDFLGYDSERQALLVGTGVFLGVSERMRYYDVGGRKVLDGWLAVRGSRPTGRIGSPLDRTRSKRWKPEWSTELAEVLSVLRHLTELEPAQASLLERVLEGPLIDVAELTRRGVLEPPGYTKGARLAVPDEDVLPGLEGLHGQPIPPVTPLNPAPLDSAVSPPASRRRLPVAPPRHEPGKPRREG